MSSLVRVAGQDADRGDSGQPRRVYFVPQKDEAVGDAADVRLVGVLDDFQFNQCLVHHADGAAQLPTCRGQDRPVVLESDVGPSGMKINNELSMLPKDGQGNAWQRNEMMIQLPNIRLPNAPTSGCEKAPLDTGRHASENPTFSRKPSIRRCEFALRRSIYRLAFDIHCRAAASTSWRSPRRRVDCSAVRCAHGARIFVGWNSVPTGSGRRPNLLWLRPQAALGRGVPFRPVRLLLGDVKRFDCGACASEKPGENPQIRRQTRRQSGGSAHSVLQHLILPGTTEHIDA